MLKLNCIDELAVFDARKMADASLKELSTYWSLLVQELTWTGAAIEMKLWGLEVDELLNAQLVSSKSLSHLNDAGEDGVMRIHGAFLKVPAFRPLIRKVALHPILPKWFNGQCGRQFQYAEFQPD